MIFALKLRAGASNLKLFDALQNDGRKLNHWSRSRWKSNQTTKILSECLSKTTKSVRGIFDGRRISL